MLVRKVLVGATVLTLFVGVFVGGAGLLRPNPAGVAAQAAPPGVPEGKAPMPAVVAVTHPVERMRTPFEDFTGRLEPGQVVEVRPQVSGVLLKVHFKDGEAVKKGDLLFEIDPRAFQAEVDQAEANVAVAAARRKQAGADLDRARKLPPGAVGPQELDMLATAAAVAEAQYKQAQAALDLARLTLERTRLTAPIDGTIGRRRLDPGNLVSGGTAATLLATILVLNPLGVSFDMDERSCLRYRNLVRDGQVKAEGAPLYVGVADEDGFPHEGTLASFAGKVDPDTGAVQVRGIVPNPGRRLMPGLFARVRVPFGKPRRVLEVPEEAVGSDQGKRHVWVVNDRNVVDRREVKVGPVEEKMRVIEEGLGADDWVVTGGTVGLRAGDRVEPRRPAK
jgi:RND family efflux transporter MFP subunit